MMILALAFQLAAAAPASALNDQQDTTRHRRRAVEVSEAYGQRLQVHRILSYAMIPVFTAQYVAGTKLYDAAANGTRAPGWAKPVHSAGAAAIAGIFTINTITGVWNLWDSRHTPEGRTLRTLHALSMLAADAGFTYAGVKLSKDAETDFNKRREHRTVALASMGVTVTSALVMKFFNK